jgi:hypothetical protein
MSDSILTTPIDIVRFVSLENEQFLVSLANNNDDLQLINHLQGLYSAAMTNVTVDENVFVIFQLLTFTHYHFLFSLSCHMRCHLSEAFASARAAIDAALIAAQIIHDRSSQVAYAKREKPFDKLLRHFRNMVKDNKTLPHALVPELLKLHDSISSFASHADIASFVHRIKRVENDGKSVMAVQYFQFATNKIERKIHTNALLHTFVMILDVFSDFLVAEQKAVPKEWQKELRELGGHIGRQHDNLKKLLPAGGSTGGI